jgi:hypothetical protein
METFCWNCSGSYFIDDRACPDCGATNPNVDLERAYQEMDDRTLIAEPALLRRQAA